MQESELNTVQSKTKILSTVGWILDFVTNLGGFDFQRLLRSEEPLVPEFWEFLPQNTSRHFRKVKFKDPVVMRWLQLQPLEVLISFTYLTQPSWRPPAATYDNTNNFKFDWWHQIISDLSLALLLLHLLQDFYVTLCVCTAQLYPVIPDSAMGRSSWPDIRDPLLIAALRKLALIVCTVS